MTQPPTDKPTRALCILWPAFVMAGVLETLVFAVVDPQHLQWFGVEPVEWQPLTLYSVAFFVFWFVIAASAAMTQFLTHPDAQ
ncbi:MAG: hypothetical protein HY856_20370 [Burkholderiales bacterium]|jgi:hypothetical protein|nr:hypothetical protein [Burkholderiales bacterium]